MFNDDGVNKLQHKLQ